TIEIFNDSLLKDSYVRWNYYEEEEPKKPMCPKYFFKEPFIFHFVYLKETVKSYQILINNNEVKYLPKIKENVPTSWEDYILNSMGIGKLSNAKGEKDSEQPFRKAPSENAPIIEFPTEVELFCPMEIKGDWVKVQYDCFYAQQNNKFEGQPCHDYISKCKPA